MKDVKVKEYTKSQLFIVETTPNTQLDEIRKSISKLKNKKKSEIILLKEDGVFSEYISEDNVEEEVQVGFTEDQAVLSMELKYKLAA